MRTAEEKTRKGTRKDGEHLDWKPLKCSSVWIVWVSPCCIVTGFVTSNEDSTTNRYECYTMSCAGGVQVDSRNNRRSTWDTNARGKSILWQITVCVLNPTGHNTRQCWALNWTGQTLSKTYSTQWPCSQSRWSCIQHIPYEKRERIVRSKNSKQYLELVRRETNAHLSCSSSSSTSASVFFTNATLVLGRGAAPLLAMCPATASTATYIRFAACPGALPPFACAPIHFLLSTLK